jgi:copper chaperone CopZ
MTETSLTAPDISCGHCKSTIETELGGRAGVRRVVVDVDTHQVHVDHDAQAISEAELRRQLAELGYPVG